MSEQKRGCVKGLDLEVENGVGGMKPCGKKGLGRDIRCTSWSRPGEVVDVAGWKG